MNRLLKIISVAALCLAVVGTEADARGRNNVQQGQSKNERRQPGNQGQRPGGGHPGNQGRRPGGGHPGNPGHYPGGGHQFNPGPRPGGGPGYGHVPPRPPYRPYMPARPMPFRAPVPPPGFRPAPGAALFGPILGVAVGTAINASLNYLLGNGYAVTGYTTDAIYINNVSQLNMLWPNATLYYSAGGMLRGSEFVYSTPYFDQTRYNTAYGYLTGAYGMPASTMPLQGGGVRVNWFGYAGQYVSLQYQPGTAYDGSYRYFTTLSFGI